MTTVFYEREFFNVKDTLECGQLFRFKQNSVLSGKVGETAYTVYSSDKACYVYNKGDKAVIVCEEKDKNYFYGYFDLERDYSEVYKRAVSLGGTLAVSASLGKGVRILNQNPEEALFSFIISQNNNIPRIKGIIERLCALFGKEKSFNGEKYFAFPTAKELKDSDIKIFTDAGLGYRAPYIKNLADNFDGIFNMEEMQGLNTEELKKRLLSIYGVGPKVADCVSLFGFHRSDSFPVDTWIEKVYRENLGGTLKNRDKIAKELVDKFGENAGYFQQYLFYYKRSMENAK